MPPFPEQITSRKGSVTVSLVVFSISLGPTYFRMSFHVLYFWSAVLNGGWGGGGGGGGGGVV